MAIERSGLAATMSVYTDTRLSSSSENYSFTKNPTPDWSELPQELLKLILSKLSFIKISRFKVICASWNSIAQSFISSSMYFPLISETPLLLLPSYYTNNNSLCFFSLEDKRKYYINKRGSSNFGDDDCWCIGFSHGWLVILEKEANPFLLNPFSQARIQLPLIDILMQVDKSYFLKWRKKVFILKAVLSCDPSSRDNNYGTVVLLICGRDFPLIYRHYKFPSTLAFCKNGDSTWTRIIHDDNKWGYCDIIFCNDLFYALIFNNSIEIWDLNGSLPVKKKEINPLTLRKMVEPTEYYYRSAAKYSSIRYLVESSCGDLLQVMRFIGVYVNEEGEVLDFQTYFRSWCGLLLLDKDVSLLQLGTVSIKIIFSQLKSI